MKRRTIYWISGLLALLVLTRCHFVAPPLRHPDAYIAVKVTGYCACPACSGWKFNWFGFPVSQKGKPKVIGQTAGGRAARPGIVAVDPEIFPPGTKFYIPGYGWGRAEDISGVRGRQIDIYFWQHSSAEKWGAQTRKVKVWYPKK